jgi:hypothetical protein
MPDETGALHRAAALCHRYTANIHRHGVPPLHGLTYLPPPLPRLTTASVQSPTVSNERCLRPGAERRGFPYFAYYSPFLKRSAIQKGLFRLFWGLLHTESWQTEGYTRISQNNSAAFSRISAIMQIPSSPKPSIRVRYGLRFPQVSLRGSQTVIIRLNRELHPPIYPP